MKTNNNFPIDFVITWVDGNDPEWQKEYFKHKGIDGDSRDCRFRDMNLLQFWFRGVEQFAPWVNKIYFVTCGQKPEWLDENNPKIVLVDHKDFIPEKYLPTFSSQAIEVNLHRISGLSEHFVYFNDDTFITAPTKPTDFFVNGLPCDSAVINYAAPRVEPLNLVPFVNAAAINRNFNKKSVMKKQAKKLFTLKYHSYLLKNIQFIMGKFFPGFKYFHLPTSFLKSTFSTIWEKEPELMDRTSSHKFRVLTDANQWLIKDWQFCEGNFYPRNTKIGCYVSIEDNNKLVAATNAIKSGKYKLICPNDADFDDYELVKKELYNSFDILLPNKSSFEKS
ncbi:MAG: Stealth CR1 domain-containing protein [Clostridia bacterium]|nr:Stealth CR1 domain-containing protein [Clostridia bacterium]